MGDEMDDRIFRDEIRRRQSSGEYIELIRAELRSFAEDYPNGLPKLEWKGLVLDDDDWILRQLFKMSGCDSAKPAHWRLLLGVLAEHIIDPEESDYNKSKYSPAAPNASYWSEERYEELFNAAVVIAKQNLGRIGRKAICDVLEEKRAFKHEDGRAIKAYALLDPLKLILSAKRSQLEDGRLDDQEKDKAELVEKLSFFEFR